ncbi:MAG: AAA family ATPase [Syntrophaceae bacterium]|nr:AAA family ATPase [Syntrophaceae bacterium]
MNENTKIMLHRKSDRLNRPLPWRNNNTETPLPGNVSETKLNDSISDMMVSASDLMTRKLPERPHIMRPWLKAGSLTLVYAKAGVGKSFFAWSVAIAVVKQLTIGEWTVDNPAGCLYTDGEMQLDDIQERLLQFAKDLPADKACLNILSSEIAAQTDMQIINITERKWRDQISEVVRKDLSIGLVILDNVSSLTPGINENSKKDWDDINQWLLTLRRMGIAVIVIHHASLKGNPRGTSGRYDNVDWTIKLKDLADATRSSGAYFQVEFVKKRGKRDNALRPFTIRIAHDPDSGLPWQTSHYADRKRPPYIIALIGLGMKQRDIAEVLECTEVNVSQIKKKAIKDGLFTEDGRPTDKWRKAYTGDTIEQVIKEFKEY